MCIRDRSYTYQFNNESITNFRKYSDKCFSCDVYYDLYVDYKTGNTCLLYTSYLIKNAVGQLLGPVGEYGTFITSPS